MRTASVVLDQVPKPPTGFRSDPGWLAGWQAADQAVAEALAAADARPRPVAEGAPSHHRAGGPAGHFTGIDAARAVVAQMAEGELLFVAASWPVRHVESFCAVPPGVTVMGNRGTNGIDGLVATSWGAALAHQARGGGRAVALLGDLAFLHDHNGLLAAARDPAPDLVLVVVDNGGGGIFHQLEQGRAEHSAAFERLYGTPHGLELLDVARAAGRAARQAADASQLREALDGDQTGVRVVIVRVAHRSAEAEHLVGLREACAGTVDALS